MLQRFRQMMHARSNLGAERGQPSARALIADGAREAAMTGASQPVVVAKRSHRRSHDREFLVIGLGRFGTSLAKALVQQGHDVVAVDVDPRRVQALSSELTHVIQIDATNEDALREIGADNFDTAVVCIGYDFEANLLATVLLRRLGVQRIIAKARTRTQKEILKQVGANEVVLPEHEAGLRLAQRLSAVDFVDYLQLSPEMSVVEMLVPNHLHGHSLIEADLRRQYGLTVLAIKRGNQFQFNPEPETRLEGGDELLVVGDIAEARRLSD